MTVENIEEFNESQPANLISRIWRRIRWVMLALLIFFAATWGWFIYDNNHAGSQLSRIEFQAKLENSLNKGILWIEENQSTLKKDGANPALLYMLKDMAEPVPYPAMEKIIKAQMKKRDYDFWRRMIDPNADVRFTVNQKYLNTLQEFQRWIAFAMAPEMAKLSAEEFENMYDAEKHKFRDLTHQLLAIVIQRDYGRPVDNVDSLIDRLSERIASEMYWDFRITDMYHQRVSFLLDAKRPDMVNRRWVERMIDYQSDDGGYVRSWHGWGPGLFKVFDSAPPNAHSTVQADGHYI